MHLKKIKFYFFFFLFYLTFNYLISSELEFGTVEIKRKGFLVEVEIADTQEEREKGLMFRTNLDDNKGMLFIFSKPDFANFWMKNTFLSLDILFISEDNIIEGFVKGTVPLNEKIHISETKVKYILEINSGLIDKIGIKLGDEVKIEY